MQDGSLSTRLGYYASRLMAGHVVEATQDKVVASHHHNGFAGDAGGHELAWLLHLFDPPHQLPGLAENRLRLEFCDSRIDVPGPGDGRRIRQRSLVVVAGE